MKKIRFFLCVCIWAIFIAPAFFVIALISWSEEFITLSADILDLIEIYYDENEEF